MDARKLVTLISTTKEIIQNQKKQQELLQKLIKVCIFEYCKQNNIKKSVYDEEHLMASLDYWFLGKKSARLIPKPTHLRIKDFTPVTITPCSTYEEEDYIKLIDEPAIENRR